MRPPRRGGWSTKRREHAQLLLRKALTDETLLEEVLESSRVADEVIGFHCQQAAEKLLKALLAAIGVGFGRTHDLGHLMDLVTDQGHILPTGTLDLDRLTPYGTIIRYDDPQEDVVLGRQETLEAIRVLRSHVEAVIAALPDDS